MLKTAIIGASGYTGIELAQIIQLHPHFSLDALYVSQGSAYEGKFLYELDGRLSMEDFGQQHLTLQPTIPEVLMDLNLHMDVIFLATPHPASHDWVPMLMSGKARVIDLSGAFRLPDAELYSSYYGFDHTQPLSLEQAVYGLAEWQFENLSNAKLVAVPGCYPTASLLALKPLMQANLIDNSHLPIISAVSGVSGAGRKAVSSSSFCEVSLQAYGVLNHRHQPEIATHLNKDVIFTPHLGNFKRGILATITVKLSADASIQEVDTAFVDAYESQPLVRLCQTWPKLDDVVHSPRCHLHWKFDDQSQYLVVSSAIDNLLKGAASQAIQCANICMGLEQATGLTSPKGEV